MDTNDEERKMCEGWKVMEFHVEERKNESEYVMFLSPQCHKPPYYYKALESQTTIGSKSKVQA